MHISIDIGNSNVDSTLSTAQFALLVGVSYVVGRRVVRRVKRRVHEIYVEESRKA